MKKQNEIEIKKADENIKRPKEMEEVTTPFFRFEKIGDKIEGILQSCESVEKFNIYTIRKYNNEIIKFHGSTQLDDLLSNLELPCYVEIIFTEKKPSKQGSDIKIFKLFRGKN
jgi:hypothetical protein